MYETPAFIAGEPGASEKFGEHHRIETHLIPNVLFVALGKKANCEIYGTDYPTPDGTCIRDYVHVNDLAGAHVKALEYLESGKPSLAANLGTGAGASVQQVISAVEKVTGKRVPYKIVPRRAGDPPALVANPAKAQATLNWEAAHGLDNIVSTAWNFMQRCTKLHSEKR